MWVKVASAAVECSRALNTLESLRRVLVFYFVYIHFTRKKYCRILRQRPKLQRLYLGFTGKSVSYHSKGVTV